MAKLRRMFPGGNTANGFYSFHDNIMGLDREKLYILKGMPGGGKSSLMKEIGERMLKEGFTIEYHHCPSDPESVDGIVIKELKIGIVDGTFPHVIDPTYPGLTDKLVDLGQFIDSNILENYKKDIFEAKRNNKFAYRKAFNYFKSAKSIYEEIVETNKLIVDFKEINKISKTILEKIFSEEGTPYHNGFNERHLFATAYTPEGYIDYANYILEGVSKVYYISGEIGTGKSTFMERVIEEAKIRDYHLEIYHNSLIPEKIESVLIEEIDTIVTSNENAANFTNNKVDFNKYIHEDKINSEDYKIFNLLVEKGIKSLEGAKNNHSILEISYKPSVNYDGVTEIKEKILEEILSYR
ncbi:hypothetical protein KQI42_10010 [Tissierella sp. MSJ-40]|uniref:ATPase n=1 Tax=Tissierella simiarum TaxID=2841534 RepID=A0ABS6E600_9FIRM|nr:hypothetical protein [Tissierella simiarum]MBU5438345.1 hypothetical protein [Tissierella simiarum]